MKHATGRGARRAGGAPAFVHRHLAGACARGHLDGDHAAASGTTVAPVNDGALCLAAVDVDRDVITSANVLSAGAGAFLSHESGAAWWGHGGFPLLPNAVSQRRGRTHRNHGDGRLHDLVEAPPRWITAYRGVSVARPELIAYQLCGNVRPERAERVLDWFWSQGLLTIASAKQCLADLAERGRNGTVVFHELLAPRSDAQHPFGSGLESRVAQIARDIGVDLRRQIESGGEQWAGRVDFRDLRLPFVLEVHSLRYHAALSYQRDDDNRHKRLEDSGLTVRVVWDDDVWTRPGHVADVIRDGRRVAATVLPARATH